MTNQIQLNIKIQVATADACFMDVGQPERQLGSLGTHIEAPGTTINAEEQDALMMVLRYTAANENVSSEWVEAGLTTVMLVDKLAAIARADFARCLMALFEVLGI